MFIKSIAVAIVAVAASVAAQGGAPAYTTFTNPVGDSHTYNVGQKVTFSWNMACVPPSTKTSKTPKATKVSLLNSTDTSNAYFIRDIITIDCSKSSGNEPWVVPELEDVLPNDKFSLRIELLPEPAYSGRFTIVPVGGFPPTFPGVGGPSLTITTAIGSTLTPAPTGGATPTPAPAGGKDEPKSAAGSVVPALSAAALIASAAAVLF